MRDKVFVVEITAVGINGTAKCQPMVTAAKSKKAAEEIVKGFFGDSAEYRAKKK